MISVTQEQLEDLYGYYTGNGEALKNADIGYSYDPKTKELTIVTCSGNDGSYSRVVLTREFLSELGYIRNIYGETDTNMNERKQLISMIKLWLNSDAENLSIEELNKIIHFCNGGDAIHNT